MKFEGPAGASRRQFLGTMAAFGATAFVPGGGLLAQAMGPKGPPPAPYLVDVHHHFYPQEFKDAVDAFAKAHGGGSQPRGVQKWTPQASLDEMDKAGIATAVLSCWSIPGVWLGADAAGMRRYARLHNEYAAKMMADHPGRFGLFAALPLPDVEGSLKEIEYAFDTLKAQGVGLMTNYGDKWPGDPAFKPVFDELNRRGAVAYFHPLAPNCCVAVQPGLSNAVLETPYDTPRAILSLMMNGYFKDMTNMKFMFAHGGGPLSVLAGRISGLTRFVPRIKQVAPQGVEAEFRKLYYDTANAAYKPTMAALLALVPSSQVLFGTDYPYVGGSYNAAGLKAIELRAADRHAIEAGNALRLLPNLATPLRKA